jgi:hypothetical protein
MEASIRSCCLPGPVCLAWYGKAFLLLIGAIALVCPAPSQAEARFAGASGAASASINLRIAIPPVMRVLENSHPAQLRPSGDGSALSGEQRIVVVSNMRHGFCVALRQSDPQLSGWQLQTSAQEGGATLTPIADGYRLCTSRPGRYTLNLQHAFALPSFSGADDAALGWPVTTEISAI